MDAAAFVEWLWSISSAEKAALAVRVAVIQANTDERYLKEARAAARASITDAEFDNRLGSANTSAAPDEWLVRAGT